MHTFNPSHETHFKKMVYKTHLKETDTEVFARKKVFQCFCLVAHHKIWAPSCKPGTYSYISARLKLCLIYINSWYWRWLHSHCFPWMENLEGLLKCKGSIYIKLLCTHYRLWKGVFPWDGVPQHHEWCQLWDKTWSSASNCKATDFDEMLLLCENTKKSQDAGLAMRTVACIQEMCVYGATNQLRSMQWLQRYLYFCNGNLLCDV